MTNAGGINPESCVQALKKLAESQGVELSVAMVTGDDMMNKVNASYYIAFSICMIALFL